MELSGVMKSYSNVSGCGDNQYIRMISLGSFIPTALLTDAELIRQYMGLHAFPYQSAAAVSQLQFERTYSRGTVASAIQLKLRKQLLKPFDSYASCSIGNTFMHV